MVREVESSICVVFVLQFDESHLTEITNEVSQVVGMESIINLKSTFCLSN